MKNKYSIKLQGDIIIMRRFGRNNVALEGFKNGRKLFYRTYGLNEQFGFEIEFNLSLDPNEAIRILDFIVNKLTEGVKFKNNVINNELTGAPVLPIFVEPKFKYYNDEKILRIVFSDENYKLPSDEGCNPAYAEQLN